MKRHNKKVPSSKERKNKQIVRVFFKNNDKQKNLFSHKGCPTKLDSRKRT